MKLKKLFCLLFLLTSSINVFAETDAESGMCNATNALEALRLHNKKLNNLISLLEEASKKLELDPKYKVEPYVEFARADLADAVRFMEFNKTDSQIIAGISSDNPTNVEARTRHIVLALVDAENLLKQNPRDVQKIKQVFSDVVKYVKDILVVEKSQLNNF